METNFSKIVFISIRKILGGKWRIPILWHITNGNNRFSLLKKNIGKMSEKMLYTELRALEEIGVIEKEVIEENSQKIVFYNIAEDKQPLIDVVGELYDLMYSELEEVDFDLGKVLGK